MGLFTIIIILLIIIPVIYCCTAKYKVDSFMDFSCEAIKNKYYQPEELIYKSNCPNLVILQKNNKFGTPTFFPEYGNINGPNNNNNDYDVYYYLSKSPNGLFLDLDYDLYYRPFYNPFRWLSGKYEYIKRKNINFKDGWYEPWKYYHNKLEYNKKLNNKKINNKYKKNKKSIMIS